MRVIKILILIIPVFISVHSVAQKPPKQQSDKALLEKSIIKIIQRNVADRIIKDSIAIYSFNFKLKITKTKEHKIKVDQLLVSDTLMYRIYPNYKQFYELDYKSLLTNRDHVTLIIPIIIANTASISTREFENQRFDALIGIKSVVKTTEESFTRIASGNNQWNENVVIFRPMNTEIFKIDRHPSLRNH
ncbi:hypothetical protein [Pedobacter gandavensis]|uniref:DUF4230 domain-containing protein n=1 Tax=Pedobacter gandavensis TaxID=2679963 RepID=A0ABR6F304_9SPHI|nr:hypothetical protein [Pedobacter gandavensis]MBB2151617.1 hypothetical protein [Pedobacter gandavensis]